MDQSGEEQEMNFNLSRNNKKADIQVKQTVFKFLQLGKPYIHWYMIRALLTLVGAPLGVLTLEASRRFINAADNKNIHLLYSAIFISIIGLAAGICLSFLRAFCSQKLSNKSLSGIQKSLFAKILKTDISELLSFHSGDLIMRINQSATAAQAGINGKVNDLIGNISQSVSLFVYLFAIHPQLTLYSVLIACVIPLLLTVRARILRGLYDQSRKKYSELSTFEQDVIIGAELVRTSLLVNSINEMFAAKYAEFQKLSRKVAFVENISTETRSFMSFLSMLFIFGYGGLLVHRGELDLGALVVFISSYGRISSPLSGIAGIWAQLQQDIVNAARVFDVYRLRDEAQGAVHHSFLLQSGARIELKNVCYSYKENVNAINRLNFTAEMNQITAIIGPSGSGKSTLIKLILGLFEPTSGELSCGGVPIKEIRQDIWRKQIAYVPQEPYFFSGTIFENISLGNPDATEQEVQAAAKKARIHDVIMRLNKQYHTSMGERGTALSGGEKQRVAIARALLRNPSILILDEAASALDSDNEMRIQGAVSHLVEGRIVIMITHRLQTVRHAEKIVLMEKGEKVEEGSFQELVNARGKFHRLYSAMEPEGGLVRVE